MTKPYIRTGAFLALSASLIAGEKTTAVLAGDPNQSTRTVDFKRGSFIPISAQTGYMTLVELPGKEQPAVLMCGTCRRPDAKDEADNADWVVNLIPDSNLIAIQPIKAGVKTVIHVMGASGIPYTFPLAEISKVSGAHADVRVVLTTEDQTVAASILQPKFVPVERVEQAEAKATAAQKELAQERERTAAVLAKNKEYARIKAEAGIKHDYVWDKDGKTAKVFGVKDIYESSGFTEIEADPQEAPAVYELRDGKQDSLIQFTYTNGRYEIPKIIDEGYLRVGKAKLTFRRKG